MNYHLTSEIAALPPGTNAIVSTAAPTHETDDLVPEPKREEGGSLRLAVLIRRLAAARPWVCFFASRSIYEEIDVGAFPKTMMTGFLALSCAWPTATLAADISRDDVNAARLADRSDVAAGEPNPVMIKAQILLDRAHVSPGVIDGYDGENLTKALSAYEEMHDLTVDGELDEEVWKTLGGEKNADLLVEYEITADDTDQDFIDEIPSDYEKLAELESVGFTSIEEMLAERHHMDIELFKALNDGKDMTKGTTILVADIGDPRTDGTIARIEADKDRAQIRAYDEDDKLVLAYPATIGSEENPSPEGTHQIEAIAVDPTYSYRPSKNFQQGENDEKLTIAAGPNNPVGDVWIDLSEPTYGIHGTSEPSEIDKTASHGCVRLTNWDANELAELVETGTDVRFID
ncbi:L,D-transpeptidase [Aurantimonas sp. A2-1-M11]|uniref:L,D-transpeptidase family protein n=1 Tax=Aurantimonas sp. A2-1-M11 TaxID=3113712 RepID=UPI002F95EC80